MINFTTHSAHVRFSTQGKKNWNTLQQTATDRNRLQQTATHTPSTALPRARTRPNEANCVFSIFIHHTHACKRFIEPLHRTRPVSSRSLFSLSHSLVFALCLVVSPSHPKTNIQRQKPRASPFLSFACGGVCFILCKSLAEAHCKQLLVTPHSNFCASASVNSNVCEHCLHLMFTLVAGP